MVAATTEALNNQFDKVNKITAINNGLRRAIEANNPPPPPPPPPMMMMQQPPVIPQPQPTFDLNEFDHFLNNHQQHEVQYGDDFMNNSFSDLLGIINDHPTPAQGNVAIAENHQVDALTEEINTLQASVDTLKEEKLELEYNLQRSQASSNTIRAENEALLNQVRELRHSVNTFRVDKEVLQNQVDSLEMSATRFREEKETLIAVAAKEKENLKDSVEKRKELQDQIDALKEERIISIKEHEESYRKLLATTNERVKLLRETNIALEEQLKIQEQEYNYLFAHWDELTYNLKRAASETPEGEPDAKRSRSNSVEPEGEDNTFDLLVSRINDAYQQIIADQHCGPYFRQKIDGIYQQMSEHKGFFDKVYEIIQEAKQSDDVDLKRKAIKLKESWKKIVA